MSKGKDGPEYTFGNSEAAVILWVEASKDSVDLRRVANLLNDYNVMFRGVAHAILRNFRGNTEGGSYGLSESKDDLDLKMKLLLLVRDDILQKARARRFNNTKISTFLLNVIKTKYTVYVREQKEARAKEETRLKGSPTRHEHCSHAPYGTHVCHDNVEYPINGAGCCDRCGENVEGLF